MLVSLWTSRFLDGIAAADDELRDEGAARRQASFGVVRAVRALLAHNGLKDCGEAECGLKAW